MREILFRGKRIDNGEWVFGDFQLYSLQCLIIERRTKKKYKVNPKTVGQYIGLTDKNGTKIFESDIVDILVKNEEIGVIVYDDGGFLVEADRFCVDFHTNINGTDVEVIGNIYDNQELLNN